MTIKVTSNLRTAFVEDRCEFVQALTHELRSHEDELCKLFHPSDPRGTIVTVEIYEIEIEDDGSGFVQCNYVEEVYYGCKDMDSEDENNDSLEFTYYPDRDEIEFKGTAPPKRSTDDEF